MLLRYFCITGLAVSPSCLTRTALQNSADLNVASIPPNLLAIFYDRNDISIWPAKDLEIKLSNGIKIYKDKEAVNAITRLVDEYPSIWKFLSFVQIFPKC